MSKATLYLFMGLIVMAFIALLAIKVRQDRRDPLARQGLSDPLDRQDRRVLLARQEHRDLLAQQGHKDLLAHDAPLGVRSQLPPAPNTSAPRSVARATRKSPIGL
jgi:hypothetical protein